MRPSIDLIRHEKTTISHLKVILRVAAPCLQRSTVPEPLWAILRFWILKVRPAMGGSAFRKAGFAPCPGAAWPSDTCGRYQDPFDRLLVATGLWTGARLPTIRSPGPVHGTIWTSPTTAFRPTVSWPSEDLWWLKARHSPYDTSGIVREKGNAPGYPEAFPFRSCLDQRATCTFWVRTHSSVMSCTR